MTRYMLDTNIISDLIRNPQGRAAKRIAKVDEDNICTSIIVAAELRPNRVPPAGTRVMNYMTWRDAAGTYHGRHP